MSGTGGATLDPAPTYASIASPRGWLRFVLGTNKRNEVAQQDSSPGLFAPPVVASNSPLELRTGAALASAEQFEERVNEALNQVLDTPPPATYHALLHLERSFTAYLQSIQDDIVSELRTRIGNRLFTRISGLGRSADSIPKKMQTLAVINSISCSWFGDAKRPFYWPNVAACLPDDAAFSCNHEWAINWVEASVHSIRECLGRV